MRIVGIIQARMGSKRFPGKMLVRLAGEPLLWHIVVRMRRCRRLDRLVLATTDAPADDLLVAFAQALNLPVIRGPEENVLERFVMAAREEEADIIARINGDAVLVDPKLTDDLVALMAETGADFVQGAHGVPCFHDGVDPLSWRILMRMATERGDDPVAREHVTGYLKSNPAFGRAATYVVEPALRVSGPRLSIDTKDDLDFFEGLYRRFGAAPGTLDLRAVAAAVAAGEVPGLRTA